MKKGISVLLFFCALCIGASCKRNVTKGSGNSTTETRTVQQFSSVAVEAPVDAVITVGEGMAAGVEITGYQNLVSLIKTEIKDGVLRIYTDELTHIDTDRDVVVKVTVPVLHALDVSGAGHATIAGTLNTDKFRLDITGAGDVTIENIIGNSFTADLSGAGDLDIKGGSVNIAEFDVTGAGEITAFPLAAKNVTANVTGAGDVEVTATQKLDASITGVGGISYKGHPSVTQSITGAGSIEDAN